MAACGCCAAGIAILSEQFIYCALIFANVCAADPINNMTLILNYSRIEEVNGPFFSLRIERRKGYPVKT